MSKRWANPFGAAEGGDAAIPTSAAAPRNRRAEIAEENRRKVQRAKVENRFLSGLTGNYQLSHIAEVREEMANAPPPNIKPRRPAKNLPPVSVEPEGFHTISQRLCDVDVMELSHGGATLWASTPRTDDILILSGATCTPVHKIPTEGKRVSALYSTETHMWVGYEDGTVQVYDHLVFIHITEGKFHDAAVTCFCELHDGRVFSAGSDMTLVKWDNESRNFEAMAKIISGHTKGVTSLACCQDSIFTSSLDSTIREFDAITGVLKRTRHGHSDEVLSVAVVREVLFSGSRDGTIRVWSIESTECYMKHDCASVVTSLVADLTSKRLWSGHGDGSIRIWMTSKEDSFAMVHSTQLQVPVKSLKALCAIDTLKIWSLASNGVNKVWASSINRIEDAMNKTIDEMKSVVANDTKELDHWRELVARLKVVDNRRKLQIARALEQVQADALRRRYQWMWRHVMLARRNHRRKVQIAGRLALDHKKLFLRRYFSMYFRWYRASQRKRLKETYSRLLMNNANKSVVQFYFAKMQAYTRHMKSAKKRYDLLHIVGANSQRGIARVMFRKWLKFCLQRRTLNRRHGYVAAVMRSTAQSLLRVYYIKWRTVGGRAALRDRKRAFCEMMVAQVASSARRYAYNQWTMFLHYRRAMRRRRNIANCFLANSSRGLLASYYRRWENFRRMKALASSRKHADAAEAELDMVKARYADIQKIIDERRALEELEKQLEAKRDAIQQRKIKLQQLRQSKDDIYDRIANQANENMHRHRSMKEQLENLLSQLKARVLNFHLDYALISQIRDKSKAVPVMRIFLEAHQTVKRLVVDLTHKPHHPVDQEWPITEPMLHKIPSHQLSVLLGAIKTMIITFDMMDRQTRDSMQTDQEIVINARWILLMAEISNEHRRKTLGKGAARVR